MLGWALAGVLLAGVAVCALPLDMTLRFKFGAQSGDDIPDYFGDFGLPFAHQQDPASRFQWAKHHASHLWYGWSEDTTLAIKRRASPATNMLASFTSLNERGPVWAIALPNGEYRVEATFGDLESASFSSIYIEDVPLAKTNDHTIYVCSSDCGVHQDLCRPKQRLRRLLQADCC
eukprot:m.703972 g.703972  ORF g.703972 m.703972 type:complete len:175 (-) comp58715_c0_seq2:306-830(-)